MLALEDLKELTKQKEVKSHMAGAYEISASELNRFTVLVAYESVGSWGCDSSNYFLLRDKTTKELWENSGSHCSCNGFENQWEPQKVELSYLKSEQFYVSTGGYDSDRDGNLQTIKDFVRKLRK